MNQIEIFKNPEFGAIRAVEIDGEPWLVGKDIALALGYKNAKDALATHVDAEDKRIVQRSENATFDIPNRGITIINESGFYSLVLSSKLPKAKQFRRWVTSEVLPTIRKHGAYMTREKLWEVATSPEALLKLCSDLLAVLEEKAAAATAQHNELSAKIKAAEKRMAEIAVLRTHIINYAKTRDTYVAYRKAGYSKKFREEHEEEILLHQAAKNAFDDMGVKKLPKVKELQAEYARLLEEKKKTYAEYQRSREEMRELLAAKANVDRLLKMDEDQKKEQEKDLDQR